MQRRMWGGRVSNLVALLLLIAIAHSCDKGLEPPPPISRATSTTVNGRIVFQGKWPSPDSNKVLAVVLFPKDPPFPVTDVLRGYLAGTVYTFSLALTPSKDTLYQIVCPPGHYGYLGVAQQYDTNIALNWRCVGYAHTAADTALHFDLVKGDSIIVPNIIVNFDSLPRQPFQ